MARLRVYIETTIVSYLTAWPSRDLVMAANQAVTREWWEQRRHAYELFTSQFVIDEASDGDPDAAARRLEALKELPLLEVTAGAIRVADEMVRVGLLPTRAVVDGYHLAVAAVGRMDALLTWNCTHLANPELCLPASDFLRRRGYHPPIVCTPPQLAGPAPEESHHET